MKCENIGKGAVWCSIAEKIRDREKVYQLTELQFWCPAHQFEHTSITVLNGTPIFFPPSSYVVFRVVRIF